MCACACVCVCFQVYGLLQNGIKLINLTGPRGVGKTEVALKVAEYARERYSFSRVLFMDFSQLGSDCSESACLERLAAVFMLPAATSGAASGSVFSCAARGGGGGDVDGTVARIRQHLLGSEEEGLLLVLDGLDGWQVAAGGRREFLCRLVTQLDRSLGQSVAMLLTSAARVEVDGSSSREVVVEGLSDACAAQLFALRAPRQLESDELYLDANQNQDPVKAFSKSKLLRSMKVGGGAPTHTHTYMHIHAHVMQSAWTSMYVWDIIKCCTYIMLHILYPYMFCVTCFAARCCTGMYVADDAMHAWEGAGELQSDRARGEGAAIRRTAPELVAVPDVFPRRNRP
jgi:hypothetical protein